MQKPIYLFISYINLASLVTICLSEKEKKKMKKKPLRHQEHLPLLLEPDEPPTPPRPPSPPAYRLQLQQALINLNHCTTMNTFSLTAAGSGKVPTKKTSFSACSTWTPFHWTHHLLSRSPPVPSFPRCTSQPSGASSFRMKF